MSFYSTASLFFLLLLLASCREEIDISIGSDQHHLVVDGLITDEYKQHNIRLRQSGSYNKESDYPPASGATVTIEGDGRTVFLAEVEPGVYSTDSLAFPAGNTYTLTIHWQGQQYKASDFMPEAGRFTALPLTRFPERFEFEYRRHQFGFAEPSMWELWVIPEAPIEDFDPENSGLQVGITVWEDGAYRYKIFQHPNIAVNGLLNFQVSHFYGFHYGKTIYQKKHSLSEVHYKFYYALFNETEWRGTLFDTTPANIPGNVSNGGLGFFGASAVKDTVFIME